jgi:opacity protein-like surface antigen
MKILIKSQIAFVGMLLSTLASAQSKNFEGFAVGLNAGYDSTATKVTLASGFKMNGFGQSNFTSNLNGSYTFAIDEKITLGLSGTYNLSDSKIYTEDAGGLFTGTNVLKLKSQYSINIEPGYVLNETTLAYFKLGYHSADYNVSTTTKSTSGVGYGVGVKYLISPNLYANLEFIKVDYSSTALGTSTGSTSNTVGTLGIGYKF